MNVVNDLQIAIDSFYYNIILSLAGLHWSLQRGLFVMGHTVQTVNQWLIEQAFAPLIEQTNASLSLAVSFAFFLALLLLGLTYMLAALIRLDIVDLRSAVVWYVAGALFFALGPALYQGMNDLRTQLAQGFYLSTLQGLEDNMGATFSSLDQVQSSDLALGPLCDYLGAYLPGAAGEPINQGAVDGLDVALAYLRADGPDVMGFDYPSYSPGCPAHLLNPATGSYISAVPQSWFFDDAYFGITRSPYYFDELDASARAASIALASSAHGRMLTAWPLILFGVIEQLVYLLITVAMGITFLSFSLAILFAFFRRTEVIARSIVDQWIELIVQTVVIALVQSLVVAFFLAGTASGNSVVVLGVGLICLIFMLIVMGSGVKAVWNSVNRLFGALGQATGGTLLSPGLATATMAGAGALAGGAAVGMGSSALAGALSLRSGATLAQSAGVVAGGSRTLSGAARTLAYLPGMRGTRLGEAAEQFSEGSVTRQVAGSVPLVGRAAGPLVGSLLLTDRDESRATYNGLGQLVSRPMLVPAVGEGLASWTTPRGGRAVSRSVGGDTYMEDETGQMVSLGGASSGASGRTRMGVFTPTSAVTPPGSSSVADETDKRNAQRRDYAEEMQGEEMEQHLSDVMRSHTGIASPLAGTLQAGTLAGTLQDERQNDGDDATRLGQVAEQLSRSAGQLTRAAQSQSTTQFAGQTQTLLGQLTVSGVPDVASVMADVVASLRRSGTGDGGSSLTGRPDNLALARGMAAVMGVQPQAASSVPVQQDLARFGLFIDQALTLGLTPGQTEQVVREVQTAPDSRLQPATRETLDRQVQSEQNVPWLRARNQVDQLERSTQLLPAQIVATGNVQVPVSVTPVVNVTTSPLTEASDGYETATRRGAVLAGSTAIRGSGNISQDSNSQSDNPGGSQT